MASLAFYCLPTKTDTKLKSLTIAFLRGSGPLFLTSSFPCLILIHYFIPTQAFLLCLEHTKLWVLCSQHSFCIERSTSVFTRLVPSYHSGLIQRHCLKESFPFYKPKQGQLTITITTSCFTFFVTWISLWNDCAYEFSWFLFVSLH